VQPDQVLTIEVPKNGPAANTRLCSAGGRGIGITPLTSMAAQRKSEGKPVRMHYAGRSRDLMAFLPELQRLLGDDLAVHADAEAGAPLDVDRLLDRCAGNDQLYVCGPKALLDNVLAKTQARGWTHERVHFELFTTPVAAAGDQSFELVLEQSGRSFTVPVGQTVLDCLIEQGCDPLFDCKRGECGVCSTAVIEGDIDHRDYVLTAREKAEGTVINLHLARQGRAAGARPLKERPTHASYRDNPDAVRALVQADRVHRDLYISPERSSSSRNTSSPTPGTSSATTARSPSPATTSATRSPAGR
jgi:vanillate O-demethylase ferredoxin subunit